MSSCIIRGTDALESNQKERETMDFCASCWSGSLTHTHTPHSSGPKTNKTCCDIFLLWQIYFSSNTQLLRRYKTDSLWFASSHSIEIFSWLLQWCDLYRIFILIYREYLINYTHFLTHFVFILQGEGHLIYIREQSHSEEKDKPVCIYSLNLIHNHIST